MRGELGGVKGTGREVRGDEGGASGTLIRNGWVGGISGNGWEYIVCQRLHTSRARL